jgi:hypothetical protein
MKCPARQWLPILHDVDRTIRRRPTGAAAMGWSMMGESSYGEMF